MSPLEPPAHARQKALGYCLPACAQMALAQLGITVNQAQLAQLLGTRAGVGTPFSRVERLAQWNVYVQLVQRISIEDLTASLAAEMAVIVAVKTTPGLPGWGNIRTQHTVLVLGAGPEQITYHDPALAYGPVSALRTEFLLAWSEMDERTALLSQE
jgi:ABC-type bacteriocin/lantibiotic exporter with double-glycine peptidase domain